MAKNLYKILKIDYNTIDNYGDVFIVYANKAVHYLKDLEIVAFTYHECEDTELFIYPQDMSVIRPIDNICKSGKLWEPDMNEFRSGGLHFPSGRKAAHYHNSLIPINKRVEMTYLQYVVSFDQISWHNLDEGEEWGKEWEFSLTEIRTPYGDFVIEGFMDVEQNGQVGIQVDVYGYLYISEIPGYDGDEAYVFIKTIAIVRHPQNVWLRMHLFDENDQYVVSFSGTEDDILDNELSHYVEKLKKHSSKKGSVSLSVSGAGLAESLDLQI